MSKANAIFRQTGEQLENLSDYIALHQDDIGAVEYDFMQTLVEIMQRDLTRIKYTWDECGVVENDGH